MYKIIRGPRGPSDNMSVGSFLLRMKKQKDYIYCDICPKRSYCTQICSDMEHLLKERGLERSKFYEILLDPKQLDHIPEERGLWKSHLEEGQTEQEIRFRKSKELIIASVLDFIDSNISSEQREVAIMYFMNKLTEQEIADIIGTTQQDIHYKKIRAIKRIRKHLASYGLKT